MNVPTQTLLPNRTIMESTFNIFYSTVNGTSFVIDGSKSQYLVTAKHLFGTAVNEGDSVEVQIKGGKIDTKIRCQVFYHNDPHIDIAILKLDSPLVGEALKLEKGNAYFLAQQCLFLGFPLFNLGTKTDIGKVPFIKRAIISAFHEENGVRLMLLDGHNNPGFSGGPVVTYSDTMDKQFIVGVISGYINQPQNVNISYGTATGQLTINENSGIIICYAGEYIQEIINKIEGANK